MRDSLAPPTQRRAYGSGGINRVQSPWRANSFHYISIGVASVLPFFFIADVMPLVPPTGFLMFLAWRLMRPGLMPLWAGVPLGAFDDLFSGQPFGGAILLWSVTMIALELLEARFPWRGFWQDWFTAGFTIAVYILASMTVSGAPFTTHGFIASGPQIVLSILLYPIIARIVAWIDRHRLSRSRRIG